MAKVKITETVLRDAHQSLIATRMKIEEMLPVISQLDDIGLIHWRSGVGLHSMPA